MKLLDAFSDVMAYVNLLARDPSQAGAEFDVVHADIDRLLDEAGAAAVHFDPESCETARFAVCAWIDERLLDSDWTGKQQWLADPLQKRLFNTVRAGEEFYVRLDGLLGESPAGPPIAMPGDEPQEAPSALSGPSRNQALEVYAACLALGFTGRYFHGKDRETLRALKGRCLRALYGDEDPAARPHLFPEAYPGDGGRRRRWRGVAGPGLVFACAVPVVVLAAMYLTYDSLLSDMLHKLLSAY